MALGRSHHAQSRINPNGGGSSCRGSALWLLRGGDLAPRYRQFAEILEAGDLYLRGSRSRRIEEFLLLEPLEDSEMQIAFNAEHGFHIANVGAEFEVERAGRHAGKKNLRRWHAQDELVCLGDGPKHLANFVWIGGARDRQGNDDPSGPVVAHEVGDNAGDEARIRYDDLGAIEGLDFGCADVDAAHEALIAANHDPVANPYRALP